MAIAFPATVIIGACGRAPLVQETSKQHVDIEVPQKDVDPKIISDILNTLDGFVIEGPQMIDIQALTKSLTVTGEFKEIFEGLIASRDPTASIECLSRKCKIVSTGRDYSFKAESIAVPVLGSPTIMLTKKINIYFELSETRDRLEICRIDGLKVKAGMFVQNLEGGLIEVERVDIPASDEVKPHKNDEDAKPSDPLGQGQGPEQKITIKNFKLDAGVGGTYPSASCIHQTI